MPGGPGGHVPKVIQVGATRYRRSAATIVENKNTLLEWPPTTVASRSATGSDGRRTNKKSEGIRKVPDRPGGIPGIAG